MKTKISLHYITFALLTVLLLSTNLSAALSPRKNKKEFTLPTTAEVKDLGTLSLEKSKDKNSANTLLILKKPKNINIVVDNYEGIEPYELAKLDMDKDGITEIVATLRYPESDNVIPYVYIIKEDGLEKIFPKEGTESKFMSCKEVFMTYRHDFPVLCLKYLVNYHDYAPPELFKLEMYGLKNGQLELCSVGYNEGTHFNLLMNLAAEYMHNGKTIEAANLYNEALASSTGDMNQQAFCEALFCNAEALKYSAKYQEAMKLFEKIVLEYTDSNFTEIAQKELEFLHENCNDTKNTKVLEEYYKIRFEIENEQSETALKHLDDLIKRNKDCKFLDRMFFTKAELLVSENRIDEAMAVFTDIKVKFPNSSLIDYVEEMIENLECKPEDTEGL